MLKILSTSWKKYSALRLYYVTIPSVVNVNINNLKQLDIHKLIMINTIILTMICPKKKKKRKKREIKKNSPFILRKPLLLLTLDWTMKEAMRSNLHSNVTLPCHPKKKNYTPTQLQIAPPGSDGSICDQGFQTRTVHWTVKEKGSRFLRSNRSWTGIELWWRHN